MTNGRWRGAGILLLVASSLGFLVAVWFDASPLLRGPEPYPPEWQWAFRADRTLEIGWLALASAGGLLLLLGLSGLDRARRSPRGAATALLAGATLLGFGLQVGLVDLEEERSAVLTLTKRTMHPWATGYYGIAVSPLARDPARFLRHHAALLPTFLEKTEHAPTHPPGAILYYRGVLAVCEALPSLTGWLVDTLRRAGFEAPPDDRGEGASRLATALLSPLLLMLLGAATCWPVSILARMLRAGPLEAARVGILWSALPGPTLMVPQLDQLLTFLTAMAVALVSVAMVRSRARFHGAAVAAGLFGGLAVFVSYGGAVHLTFGGSMMLLALLDRPEAMRRLLPVLMLTVAAAVATSALPILFGNDPIESFRAAMKTHFGVYTLRRSYGLWLVFNLWDLAVFLSIPVALLGIHRLARSVAALRREGWWRLRMPLERASIAAALLLLLFDASGLVRGEVGRSWMPIMPFLLVAATTAAGRPLPVEGSEEGGAAGRAAGEPLGRVVVLGSLLLANCWVLRLCWSL